MTSIFQAVLEFFAPQGVPTDYPTGTRPLAKRGQEERRSGRCRVPKERQPCELKVGDNVLSGLLANESKRGFAVLIDRLDGLKVGEKVELRTEWGRFKVRVVFVNSVVPPDDVASDSASWFQVGMKVMQRLE
jgi:hypothetical protein